jgi:baculoviral IAP repeat-containing protein 6
MMRNALRLRKEFSDKQGEDMLWLCREISDLSTYLKIEEWWTQARGCNAPELDHGIVEVPDKEIWFMHMLAPQARQLMQSPPGRIKRLITEMTSLRTGLSSGIYVKHAMSRPDLMK